MSFVEIYNEQLFDLLQPAGPAPLSQRRFNLYGGSESSSFQRASTAAATSAAQKQGEHGAIIGGGYRNPQAPTRVDTPQQAVELTIYERLDGSTYVKVRSFPKLVTTTQAALFCCWTTQRRGTPHFKQPCCCA